MSYWQSTEQKEGSRVEQITRDQLLEKTKIFAETLAGWDKRIIEIIAIGSLTKEQILPDEIIELVCALEPEPDNDSCVFFAVINLLARDEHEHVSEKLGIPNSIDLGFVMGGKVYMPNGIVTKPSLNPITLWEHDDE